MNARENDDVLRGKMWSEKNEKKENSLYKEKNK